MSAIARVVKWVVLTIVVVAGAGATALYALSERKLSARFDVPDRSLAISTTHASFERGEHLVRSVGACVLCHGDDLGGGVYADMGQVGIVAGPNLTRGRGGLASTFELADWVRAIRDGVRRNGTSLIMMPSEEFTNFSDEDLSSMIAHLEQAPPVDREVPKSASSAWASVTCRGSTRDPGGAEDEASANDHAPADEVGSRIRPIPRRRQWLSWLPR
jgi:cytochrome c553